MVSSLPGCTGMKDVAINEDFYTIPPILMYHLLDADVQLPVSLSAQLFEAQISVLAEAGLKCVLAREILDCTKTERDGTFAITFDDAYVDVCDIAAPILEKHGFQATVFVTTDVVGMENTWNPKANYFRRHMNWGQLADLMARGFEIASHGCSHRCMLKLPESEVQHEVVDSKKVIEDRLGVSVRTFSYPYGDFSTLVANTVKRHYSLAFTADARHVKGVDLRYRLPRIAMLWRYDRAIVELATHTSLWLLGDTCV